MPCSTLAGAAGLHQDGAMQAGTWHPRSLPLWGQVHRMGEARVDWSPSPGRVDAQLSPLAQARLSVGVEAGEGALV